MTKKEMIEIIRSEEHIRYTKLLNTEKEYGRGSRLAQRYRAKWSTIYDLCKQLHIKVI